MLVSLYSIMFECFLSLLPLKYCELVKTNVVFTSCIITHLHGSK